MKTMIDEKKYPIASLVEQFFEAADADPFTRPLMKALGTKLQKAIDEQIKIWQENLVNIERNKNGELTLSGLLQLTANTKVQRCIQDLKADGEIDRDWI